MLQAAAAEVGARAAFQVVNIRDAEAVDAAMQAIWDDHGPLTGVINNAAANFIAPTKDLSPNAYEAVNATVQDGSYFTTLAAGRRWIADGLPGSVAEHAHDLDLERLGLRHALGHGQGRGARHDDVAGGRVGALRDPPQRAHARARFPTDYAWQMLAPTDDVQVGATEADGRPARAAPRASRRSWASSWSS